MNLKERKNKLETSVVEVLKNMLDKDIDVKAQYSIENDIMAALIVQSVKSTEIKDAIDHIVAYTCAYDEEKDALSVSAFARRYAYDSFGVSLVVNNSVTIDEQFVNGIKAGIKAGIAALDAPAPAEATAQAE